MILAQDFSPTTAQMMLWSRIKNSLDMYFILLLAFLGGKEEKLAFRRLPEK